MNGKKPTLKQKRAIKAAGWNPDNWLVIKSPSRELHIQHRHTRTVKIIPA